MPSQRYQSPKMRFASPAGLWMLLSLVSSSLLFVSAVREVPLPHVDIFMFCSNDIATSETFDFERELEGFFTDLLPSALDVTISGGSEEYDSCEGNLNRTQVMLSSDGIAELDSSNPLTQAEIERLVTVELLSSYFKNACKDRDTFEAIISEAGSEPATGPEAALTHFFCDVESAAFLAKSLETAAIASIVISIILVLCFLACICACCGFCM